MSNNSMRTTLLFGLIAIMLGAAVIGGVFFVKARNSSHITPPAKVAQSDTSKQSPQETQNNKSASTKDQQPASSPQAQKPQNPAPAESQAPVPSTPSTSTPTTQSSIPQQSTLPKTYALSPADFGGTIVMVGLAAYFGGKLLRARADFRRYINS